MQPVFFQGEPHPHRQYCLSEQLARQIGTQPGQCYVNAASCLALLSDLSSLQYVEGWVVTPNIGKEPILLIEHAWLELEGWGVIDPSIIFWQNAQGFGETQYFAGLRYGFSHLLALSPDNLPAAHVQSPATSLPAGMGCAPYLEAFQDALSHAQICAQGTLTQEIRIMPSCNPEEELLCLHLPPDPG